jgi:hypothetical protein
MHQCASFILSIFCNSVIINLQMKEKQRKKDKLNFRKLSFGSPETGDSNEIKTIF